MDDLQQANYTTTDKCDVCDRNNVQGTMLHAHDAMGWATPVLFQCNRCANPPVIDRIARRIKRIVVLAKYYWNTSPSDRAKHKARRAYHNKHGRSWERK